MLHRYSVTSVKICKDRVYRIGRELELDDEDNLDLGKDLEVSAKAIMKFDII